MVALVVGGRHPGHYFLDSDDFNDVVTRLISCVSFCHIPFCRTDVCPVKISPPGVVVRRAGATARWRMFNSNDEYRCLSSGPTDRRITENQIHMHIRLTHIMFVECMRPP